GKVLFIDSEQGRIVDDAEIKETMSGRSPYEKWIRDNMVDLDKLPKPGRGSKKIKDVFTAMKAFGYTREDLKAIIKPMAEIGKEPIGSMGNDTPHAVLSKKSGLLYAYFKQLFAQVTNPAIDPIREELIMSLESFIGHQKNILEESPQHACKLRVGEPILTDEQLEKIRVIGKKNFRTKVISTLFKASERGDFIKAIDRICEEAVSAIENGYTFIILSDRGVNKDYASLPALLATGAVHHHLVRQALRTRIGIIVESAEPREVHHFALLFGYGADCINPYLAYKILGYLIKEGELDLDFKTALKNYKKAVEKGILKILSKMGISTLRSYRGAQIFEALGLNEEVIDKCFAGTVSRIGGAGLDVIAKETLIRHKEAYPDDENMKTPYLVTGGMYQWMHDGKFHL
ncbi:MAG: glutamate synthase central domain-containing protein, partial [Candidatus Omnitrophota bacterium]